MTELLAWHFVREDRRLGYGDGREVKVGETLTVDGPLEMCARGLHASTRAIDALHYAPGPIACRVRLSGQVLQPTIGEHADKACATERTVLAMVDATALLRGFVRDTLIFRQPHMVSLFEKANLQERARALRALEMETATWDEIQKVCSAAGDAAGDAAWDAAWDATRVAAWDAAWDAAWAAAGDAAGDAAWDAAWDAARDAAWAAARDAARAAAGDAAWDAARAAAGDAAWDATWDALNARLEARLTEVMGVLP